MAKITKLIIHCSDTPNGRADTAEDILHWHTDPKPQGHGWKHAGYHKVIEIDGAVKDLVPLNDDSFIEPWEIANGARGHNSDSIHICMIGRDAFTQLQWDALDQQLVKLGVLHPAITVHGHREFNAAKSCPGFDVSQWLTEPVRIQQVHLWEGKS